MLPPSRIDRDDVRAISAALALFLFFLFLKAHLFVWYTLTKHRNPLADAPLDAPLLVFGADVMFCALLACGYFVLLKTSNRLPRRLGLLLRHGVPPIIHAAIVVFATASFVVTRLYGWPLNIDHIRTADDLSIIRASLAAYLGALPLTVITLGVALYAAVPYLARTVLRVISGRRRWQTWSALLGFAAVMFGAWGTRLAGIDTFGVKDNAVIYFARHYRSPLRPIDARAELARLRDELGDGAARAIESVSLRSPRAMLTRDFDVAAFPDVSSFNVLIVQMESTSAAYIDAVTTPNVIKLARDGVSFVNHSTVYTETTRASYSLLWSDYLEDLGTSPRLLYERPLPQQNLARVLRDHGFATGFFHSGFLSWGDFRFLFERTGFDTVVDGKTLSRGDRSPPWSWGVREEDAVDALTQWISAHRRGQFFAVYATMFPHHPYDSLLASGQQPFHGGGWVDRYRNSLHYADLNVGRVVQFLSNTGLLDRTIIVVVGDHGETVSSYPVGHGIAVTPEEIRTPLVISNPHLFPSAQRSRVYSSHLDVAPTVAGLLGITPPQSWLGRRLCDERYPAVTSHLTVHLSRFTAIIDNGWLASFSDSGSHRGLYALSEGAMRRLPSDPDSERALDMYRRRDLLMQKWIRYRHLLRATDGAEDDTLPAITPRLTLLNAGH